MLLNGYPMFLMRWNQLVLCCFVWYFVLHSLLCPLLLLLLLVWLTLHLRMNQKISDVNNVNEIEGWCRSGPPYHKQWGEENRGRESVFAIPNIGNKTGRGGRNKECFESRHMNWHDQRLSRQGIWCDTIWHDAPDTHRESSVALSRANYTIATQFNIASWWLVWQNKKDRTRNKIFMGSFLKYDF
jgi:hypothetical protein